MSNKDRGKCIDCGIEIKKLTIARCNSCLDIIFDTKRKKCVKCQIVKPLDDYYLDKNTYTGYFNVCKNCMNRTATEIHNKERAEQIYTKKEEMQLLLDYLKEIKLEKPKVKQCGKCKELLSYDGFYKDSQTITGKGSYCKGCCKEKDKQWRLNHPCYSAIKYLKNKIKTISI